MALEAVIFEQDPFIYGCKDYNYNMGAGNVFGLLMAPQEEKPNIPDHQNHGYWDSPPSSSPETCGGVGDGFLFPAAAAAVVQRKRRRSRKSLKNKDEMEKQRMSHIAVERNRRRQMNDYLAILRSLMPPSYAQRGEQASIVGGAINFVKELEQLLQFLEAHHKSANQQPPNTTPSNQFSNFFTFPQYSTSPSNATAAVDAAAERRSGMADIEVEDECHLSTVNEIATTVHDIVGMIQEGSVTAAPPGESHLVKIN
ncbi:hypothetical protein DH2020_015292 [Rehmannia glutinosa]|uniref:BHLH domain-containing protein n=1 Tax=Rehmannia glutinosa TaxID=99300 RepID=A0ABR0WWF0_REHGL